ncbi:MAG: FHA domain-containing protein [Chloroflexi bacterium]|nr:FHA domain-containing protein [Chloroflexota bacterium]
MYDNEPTMMGQGRPTATLVVRQGTQAGMSFVISGNQVVLGREEGLDIVLQDPESSRRHARVSWQGGRYVIEDMGSTNGTFVNGMQITTPLPLNPGDSIGIGQTALVFQLSGAEIGPSSYQPTPQQAPTYAQSSSAPVARNNKSTQYVLYGCGCLLLLAICFLLVLIGWVWIDPNAVDILGF